MYDTLCRVYIRIQLISTLLPLRALFLVTYVHGLIGKSFPSSNMYICTLLVQVVHEIVEYKYKYLSILRIRACTMYSSSTCTP